MINLSSTMSGRFTLVKGKCDADGNPITAEKVAEFDNIITDQGLNEIGTRAISSATDYCHVGTGNTTPAATDTGLVTFVAASNTQQSLSETAQTSTSPYYLSRARTVRFGAGAAAGNLAEVGVGWAASGTVLFSRALILDGGGSPTAITVLSDEYLDVTYELRIYPPAADATGTITLDSVVYDYTARPCERGAYSVTSAGWDVSNHGVKSVGSGTSRVYDGLIGAQTASPAGGISIATSVADGTYSDSSLQGSTTSTWGLNDGNFAGGVRSLRIKTGWALWQVEFAAQSGGGTIPKDNTKTLSFTVTHSWARKTL